MPHYATLNDYQFKDRVDDLRGCNLYGVDDNKLGTIDDVIFEHGSGEIKYAVVDTGGWSSHKFLIPAERIHSYDRDPDALQVDVVQEHVERFFPPYDAKVEERDEDWRDYEGRYKRAISDNRLFENGPVLHKRGSTHMLTPEASELPATGSGEDLSGLDLEPQRIAGKFTETSPGGGKLQMAPAGTENMQRTVAFGNEATPSREAQDFSRFTGKPLTNEHTPRTLDDGGAQDTSGWAEHAGGRLEDLESRSTRHRHAEGKVEEISSSPNFRPADAKPPMGSMGEDIQPLADPDAQSKLIHPPEIEVGTRGAGRIGASQGELVGDRRELRNAGDPAAASHDSITIPESADTGVDHRLQDRNMNQVAHPNENVVGTGRVAVSQDDMHSRPERWARFEDLLRRHRVDIESKCPQCAPAKDRRTA
jgi:PRC-barrel domain